MMTHASKAIWCRKPDALNRPHIDVGLIRDELSPYVLSATLYVMTRYALKPCTTLALLVLQHLHALASWSSGGTSILLPSGSRSLALVWRDLESVDSQEPQCSNCHQGQGNDSTLEFALLGMTDYAFSPSSATAARIAQCLATLTRHPSLSLSNLKAIAAGLAERWRPLSHDAEGDLPNSTNVTIARNDRACHTKDQTL